MNKMEKNRNDWQNFENAIDSWLTGKKIIDENLKKQGLHNIGYCHLCGNIHYADDPILFNPKMN
jgi:ubiquinone/menaquinone biosynthesis C-methylase UbiE